jgi:hypothetical protein
MPAEKLLPEGTLLYREYEAVMPDDRRVTIAVTLDDLWDGSQAAADARTTGAAAYGHILLVDGAESEPPMVWTCDGAEARIVATPRMAGTMEGGLRDAIEGFLLHFLAAVWQELEAIEDDASTVH